VRSGVRPLNPDQRDNLKEQIDDWIAQGVIEPCSRVPNRESPGVSRLPFRRTVPANHRLEFQEYSWDIIADTGRRKKVPRMLGQEVQLL